MQKVMAGQQKACNSQVKTGAIKNMLEEQAA
jgi:hypothetical protein